MNDDTSKFDRFLMKVPALKSFCLVIDVDTGTVIVGFIGAISASIWFILDIVYLSVYTDLLPQCADTIVLEKQMMGILIFELFIQFFLVLAFSFLIAGYKKQSARMVKTFLLAFFILLCAKLVTLICFLAFSSIMMALITLFYLGFHIYYFLVVTSYYQDMDDGGRHY